MRYKVGDKVRIRGDLKAGKTYGARGFANSMTEYRGKIARVAEVLYNAYQLDIDGGTFDWTDEMLRPAEFKIWCETKEEKQAVLEELEKEGYVWKSGREKPTDPECIGLFGKKPYGLYMRNDELGWGDDKQGFYSDNRVKLTPSEFTGIDFSKKIIIEQTATGAKATYGGKEVCADGKFEDASRQALAEVLCPFKVGDKVKLKRNGVVGEVIDISGKTRVIFHTKKDIHDEWCLLSELEPYTEPSYNAKLFCIKSTHDGEVFKSGHIYEVKDGIIDGFLKPESSMRFKDIKDVNKTLYAQFMEVKE